MNKLLLLFFITVNVQGSSWTTSELEEIKSYFPIKQKTFKAREKAVFYSQSFFRYVALLEKESYTQFLKNDFKLIKERGIVQILEEYDWKELIIRFQQYKDSPSRFNGNK